MLNNVYVRALLKAIAFPAGFAVGILIAVAVSHI